MEQAVEAYGSLIEQSPDRAEAYYKRANVLSELGRLEPALADYGRAIACNPSYTYAFCNRGSVYARLGRRHEALADYEGALALDPMDCVTHYNRGSVLKDLQRFEEGLASYESAIALNEEYAEAYVNRGILLQELRRHEAAIESFSRAIALKPGIAEAFQGRAVSFHTLKRLARALADYTSAVALKPDAPGPYLNRGNLLSESQRHEQAAADFLKATQLDPSDAEGFERLGSAMLRSKKLELAVANFDKAIALRPTAKFLLGTRRAARMQLCEWDGLAEDLDLIAKGVRSGEPVCHPLTIAALMDSPELQRTAAEIWVRDQIQGSHDLRDDLERIAELTAIRARSAKIRIGYFSSDLRSHPVGFLMAGLFERHDRTRFEVTAFAFGPKTTDPMQERIAKAVDRFIDVSEKSDFESAMLARDLGIDIAIDLNGFSEGHRANIFALRAAPVQINFLGFPGTMGADFMDYLIADDTVVPASHQAHYAEKIIQLPGSFLPFDSSYAIADKSYGRVELSLPRRRVRILLLQQQQQDHARRLRSMDEDPEQDRGQCSLAGANQRGSLRQSSQAGRAARRRWRTVGLRRSNGFVA